MDMDRQLCRAALSYIQKLAFDHQIMSSKRIHTKTSTVDQAPPKVLSVRLRCTTTVHSNIPRSFLNPSPLLPSPIRLHSLASSKRRAGEREQSKAHFQIMGVKAELKAARATMQAGDPSEAFSMVQKILDGASPDLKDAQTLYAVLITAGLAGLASQDLTKAERSFRRAAESIPGAPQVHQQSRNGLLPSTEDNTPSQRDSSISNNAPRRFFLLFFSGERGEVRLFQHFPQKHGCCVSRVLTET